MNNLSCLCKKLEVVSAGLLGIETCIDRINLYVLAGSSFSKKFITNLKREISQKSLRLSGFEIARLLGTFYWIIESLERIKRINETVECI